MNPSNLAYDYVTTPLVACFSDISPLWRAETQRCFAEPRMPSTSFAAENSSPTWKSLPSPKLLNQPWLKDQPFIALGVPSGALLKPLELIYRVSCRGAVVAVIGEPALRKHLVPLTAAGTVVLVTDIFGCQQMAETIKKMNLSRKPVLSNWQTRYVNRLPWSPV